MQTITISQCNKKFQFHAFEKWPKHLPAIAWENNLLCGFDRDDSDSVINIEKSHATFLEVFQSIYKEISFAEFAQVSQVLENSVEEFAHAFHFSWNQNQQQLISQFLKLPQSFQIWCIEKKVSANEIAILNSFKNLDSLNFVCDYISSHPIGKQIGVQILELSGELILMEKEIQNILNSHPPEVCLSELKKLRFPQTSNQDQLNELWVKSQTWPSTSHSKWIRRGDKSGVELKLFFSNPLELQKNIIQLQRIGEKWNTQSDQPS